MDSNISKKVDHEPLAEINDLVNDDIELKHEEKYSNDAESIVDNYNPGFLRRPQKFDKVSKLMYLLREGQINREISSNFCGLLIKPKLYDLVNDDVELKHEEKDSNDAESIVENYNSGFLRRPQKFDEIKLEPFQNLLSRFSDK